jgi:hypothetical protein
VSDIKANRKRVRFVLSAALPLVLASGATLAAGPISEMQREDFLPTAHPVTALRGVVTGR